MSPIERLPTEIVQYIAELCTWDSASGEDGFVSEIDVPRYKCGGKWQPQKYARYHAAFARTSHHFHGILNERLYTRNLSRDPNYCSCLRWAVAHNRLETIKRAEEYGADLSSYGLESYMVRSESSNGIIRYCWKVNGVLMTGSLQEFDYHSTSPLEDAVVSGRKEFVEYLLGAEVDVEKEYPNLNGFPLETALHLGHEDIAEMLVEHGAYLSEPGFSALPLAFAQGFQGVVKALLQRNDPISLVGKLHIGASSDNLELVKQGLDGPQVNVNARCPLKNTALHLAINSAKGELDVIEFLLQQPGIQLSIYDRGGHAPIHLAALKGRMDIFKLLAEMPGSLNYRTDGLDTVLHVAAQATNNELFTYLLDHPDLGNPEGEDLRRLERIFITARAMSRQRLFYSYRLEPDFN